MRYQIVTLRVPFDPAHHKVPSTWNWDRDIGLELEHEIVVLDSDPVSEDPDVQPIERLPEPAAGDPCPHPDCDLHLLWDPQERMLYCTMDWDHG